MPSVTLGKLFAECKLGFAECLGHSAKNPCPVVYDGKSDPLIFINRCESYFHQQRIMEEEKVWMASYNLEDGAQMWYIQVQKDEGIPSWRRSKDLLHLCYDPLFAPIHLAS